MKKQKYMLNPKFDMDFLGTFYEVHKVADKVNKMLDKYFKRVRKGLGVKLTIKKNKEFNLTKYTFEKDFFFFYVEKEQDLDTFTIRFGRGNESKELEEFDCLHNPWYAFKIELECAFEEYIELSQNEVFK